MVSPPWEPYPERKRKLEERAKRPKNKQDRQKSIKKHCRKNPATDSSFSSSSSASGGRVLPADGLDGGNTEPATDHHQHHTHGAYRKDGHVRVRPEDCWCLRESGCGDEDGCCVEDLPGAVVCPCFQRVSTVHILEVSYVKSARWSFSTARRLPRLEAF